MQTRFVRAINIVIIAGKHFLFSTRYYRRAHFGDIFFSCRTFRYTYAAIPRVHAIRTVRDTAAFEKLRNFFFLPTNEIRSSRFYAPRNTNAGRKKTVYLVPLVL